MNQSTTCIIWSRPPDLQQFESSIRPRLIHQRNVLTLATYAFFPASGIRNIPEYESSTALVLCLGGWMGGCKGKMHCLHLEEYSCDEVVFFSVLVRWVGILMSGGNDSQHVAPHLA